MERKLIVEDGTMRVIVDTFPNSKNSFRQRKNCDEYYFDGTTVELTIDHIAKLNSLGIRLIINRVNIVIF